MFGKEKQQKATKVDTLIGKQTELRGDILFSGGLHIDGTIKGNVIADSSSASLLTLSEHGAIEGEVRVPHVILNGRVVGDVHASESIELAAQASVTGNVYYSMIEMAMGAEVNGKLVRRTEAEPRMLTMDSNVEEHASGSGDDGQ
ncbi:MAG: bactofilin family protein [Gammaproteobacteria bacterium]